MPAPSEAPHEIARVSGADLTGAPLAAAEGMLRFDRYLVEHQRALDLASGQVVELERASLRSVATLFQTRGGRTLIDLEAVDTARIEIWEPWIAGAPPPELPALTTAFIELLECARLGAPRAFDLPAGAPRHGAYIRRHFAREARVRGWVPVSLDVLASFLTERRQPFPAWIADRSLVIFADVQGLPKEGTVALLHLARRDARPHVIVRTLSRRRPGASWRPPLQPGGVVMHETAAVYRGSASIDAAGQPPAPVAGPHEEATARWRWLVDGMTHRPSVPLRAIELARVLVGRDQPFEARALAEPLAAADAEYAAEAAAVISKLDEQAASRARKGWEMVDDFVDVLQLCQDIEDEQTALARVGAFVRDRLQATSVAFVVREGQAPRVLTRVGAASASVDLAVRAMDTGVSVAPARFDGPVESACPVRHAAEVIGALWCRWGMGMPIAPQHAATLLGVAAAAAAPSVRLALARALPVTRETAVPELVGESRAMADVRDAIVRAAASPFPVIIEGESGSGKELAARAIHSRSPRRDRRFCALNCAALVDELVEAELFGHVRGAFTGANTDRPGLFEDAGGGTLFMDEIAELGPRVQAKVLRVLQEGEVRRVGETHVRKIDVRIVSATNRPLAQEVASGAFRADLWYRLDVIRIALPPLRERIEDVPLLANHLWRGLAARTGSRAVLSPATIKALSSYDWPGNIRELQNVLASIMVSAPRAGLVGPAALPAHVGRVAALDRSSTLASARRQFEVRYVRAALARAGGRPTVAARDLGLTRQGLAKLMGRLGIPAVNATSI